MRSLLQNGSPPPEAPIQNEATSAAERANDPGMDLARTDPKPQPRRPL